VADDLSESFAEDQAKSHTPPQDFAVHATRSTPSQRILAAGVLIAFCIWASSVIMTLLFAVLAAYFLDPPVSLLERMRVPRALGALIVLLLASSLVGGTGYLLYDRVDSFSKDWPRYSKVLRDAATEVDKSMQKLESRFSEITPVETKNTRTVSVEEPRPLRAFLIEGLGSFYSILLLITFVPFLVFFMLAAKRQIWHVTLELFPLGHRGRAKNILDEMSRMLRGYVAGNALVAVIMILASYVFFSYMGLDYPFLTGLVSGLLNMVPYIGLVLSWAPPILIGITKWKVLAPYLEVAGTLTALHIISMNVLIPAIIGRTVRLNAVALTVGLLFWGWAWGAVGFILAIPIIATAKVICDNVEGWEPVGRWLGSS
jgi:predicted PurR-regulated permease PerM